MYEQSPTVSFPQGLIINISVIPSLQQGPRMIRLNTVDDTLENVSLGLNAAHHSYSPLPMSLVITLSATSIDPSPSCLSSGVLHGVPVTADPIEGAVRDWHCLDSSRIVLHRRNMFPILRA